jgi:Lon protease-like protein
MRELPMFPLGTVLFPHMVLPLHVFEPRYRALMHDVLETDREFGVTLISRGHEVGGGDLRTDVGTVAKVVQAEEMDDGRWLVIGVGTRRFRVERWLPDAPYPIAEVVDLPDDHVDERVMARVEQLVPRLRRVLAMHAELGEDGVPSPFELAEDPEVACWQAAVMAPLNPFDAQRALATDRCTDRLDLVEELLIGLTEALEFRLNEQADGGT